MLHPNQFQVMEAWVAFQLNAVPIQTDIDGDFDAFALMDVASCFILSSAFIARGQGEMMGSEARHVLEEAWSHKQAWPQKLIISVGHHASKLVAESSKLGIDVIEVPEGELQPLIQEARDSFAAHFAAGRLH